MNEILNFDERIQTKRYLDELAEVWFTWYRYFPIHYATAPRNMLESLILEFGKIPQPLPVVLEPTYISILNLLSGTGKILEMRDEGLQTQALWDPLIERAQALGEHPQRMQQFVIEPGV